MLYNRVGAGAGAAGASFFFPEPESHKMMRLSNTAFEQGLK
jgi:hypothetical protein